MAAVYTQMQPQEELAALFSRNLTLNPVPQPAPAPVQEPQKETKIVYISQHYTHSAHIARQEAEKQRSQPPQPASEPSESEHAAVEQVLREHSVDPSGLSSAQLQLFKRVDTPEKLRLIELWRTCPPVNRDDNPTLDWSMTSVAQEETLARLRFERQQQQLIDQQLQQDCGMMQDESETEPETIMSLDGTPLTPVQAGDGRWISTGSSYSYMEPYMASGYEELARREYEESARRAYAEAVSPTSKETTNSLAPAAPAGTGGMLTFNPSHADPVYKTTNTGVGLDWAREAAMADQYGRLMAMREDEEML
ncbi:hypothetical protein VTH82DRAFT_3198 [Thermothelomyces myriococcoides]